MTRETIGHIEFTREGERLSLRYSRHFVRDAAWRLLAVLLVGAALLPWLTWKAAHSDLLRWNLRALLCFFLPFAGAVLTIIALVCLAHLVFRRHRALVFDHDAGTCSLPRWFGRPQVLPLSQIEGVLVTVRESRPRQVMTRYGSRRTSGSISKTTRLVLRGRPRRYQRLWGWVGLPADVGVEPVAQAMSAFVGCPCATVQAVPGRALASLMDAAMDRAARPSTGHRTRLDALMDAAMTRVNAGDSATRQVPTEPEEPPRPTEPAGQPGLGVSETFTAAVPYGIDQRPMPTGEDLDQLLPPQVRAPDLNGKRIR
jgi:hypothetical protein